VTPNGTPHNHADEIANARAYAAEEALHPAFRAAMVRDAEDDNRGLGAAALILFGAVFGVMVVVAWAVLAVLP
jgi:hypothetical protein